MLHPQVGKCLQRGLKQKWVVTEQHKSKQNAWQRDGVKERVWRVGGVGLWAMGGEGGLRVGGQG